MTPIDIENDILKIEQEQELKEEYRNMSKKELLDVIDDLNLQIEPELPELIHKAMNNLNTFQCCDGELYLRGTDEYGKDFQICFDAYDFLNWIDTEQIEYIKEQLIKHIQTK
tara:strand:+ start:925 stop:1260 length:336 start_codon:yes stop_codon:yes gene_type:complete